MFKFSTGIPERWLEKFVLPQKFTLFICGGLASALGQGPTQPFAAGSRTGGEQEWELCWSKYRQGNNLQINLSIWIQIRALGNTDEKDRYLKHPLLTPGLTDSWKVSACISCHHTCLGCSQKLYMEFLGDQNLFLLSSEVTLSCDCHLFRGGSCDCTD